jgi:8-oxo-dGTP diphosphatase
MNKIVLAGCIIPNNDSILLLQRKKTNWYELPGGKIKKSELPEDAAKRELKEELMCDIEIIRRVGTRDFEEKGYVMTYIWFLAKIKKGQTPKIGEPDKYSSYKYVPIAELSKHRLSPNMKNLALELERKSIQLE